MEIVTAFAGKAVRDAGKAAVSAAGEAVGNAVTDTGFIDALLGKLSLQLGDCFHRYLRNAEKDYNEVRTLATEPELRAMTGDDGIYVEVGVSLTKGREEREISASAVENLLKVSKRILIEGSGGMGKSMLMKYLFLDTVRRGAYMREQYIPVFLELRRVRGQTPGKVSIPELVYFCMENHGVKLPRKHFPESLKSVRYLFLMDGFDEVKEELSAEVAEKIQDFSTRYPQHAFIVTSRPANDYEHAPFENFTKMKSLPLNKRQAALLALKISKPWKDADSREKAAEFCRQLEADLYEKHKSFAENPLLLSMMFLTFMRNSSIPDHEAEFYKESYDALYSKHDTHDKGHYEREFQCRGALGKEEFTRLFARFCFVSYLDEKYDFTEEEILDRLRDSAKRLKLQVDAEKYLSDLRKIVCMIVRDGNTYQFAHRSFQEYFAAVYTAGLEDSDQKRVLETVMEQGAVSDKSAYYRLLFQLEGERFAVNALEDGFRKLLRKAERSENPDVFLLKRIFGAIYFHGMDLATLGWTQTSIEEELTAICVLIGKDIRCQIANCAFVEKLGNNLYYWDHIDTTFRLTDEERQSLYAHLVREAHIPEFRAEMRQWLDELDNKRKSGKRKDFYKAL